MIVIRRSSLAPLVLLLAAVCLAALGCDDGGSNETSDTNEPSDTNTGRDLPVDATGELTIDDLVVVPNPANVLSFFVEWRTDQPASATLEVTCGDDYALTAETGTDTDVEQHAVYIQGLYDGAQCELAVTATASDGVEGRATTTFDVGPLPDFLPSPTVVSSDPTDVEPGWTLVNLNNHFDDVPLTAAIIDVDGRYRWYHRLATSFPGSDNEVRVLPDSSGVLFCGTRAQILPTIVDWQGSARWSANLNMHHDCRFVDEELNVLRYLTDEVGDCPQGIGAGAIIEYDRETEQEVWHWNICEHWLPDTVEPDWSHLNAIEPVAGENAIVISSRSQHSLFKVDRDTGDVVWGLGLNGDFDMANEDLFYRQHAPEVVENGNIVLFDNGRSDVRPYSRLIEIAYDETNMTAEVVWEYVPDPQVFAPIWGDADRLANGNTLGTFGVRRMDELTHLIEVRDDGTEAWHVTFPAGWGVYRADRIAEVPRAIVQ